MGLQQKQKTVPGALDGDCGSRLTVSPYIDAMCPEMDEQGEGGGCQAELHSGAIELCQPFGGDRIKRNSIGD